MTDQYWGAVIFAGYLCTLPLIAWVLLENRRSPASSVAWVMAIVLMPYFGAVLFLSFGINRLERRAPRKREATMTIGSNLPQVSQYQLLSGRELTPLQSSLMKVAGRVSETMPTVGNDVELVSDTRRTLGLIEQAIGDAQDTLHLEFYIWRSDRTGTRVRDLLIERARAGVKVRFLYDGFGSLLLNQRWLRPMRDAGIHVAAFHPGQTIRERWSLNLRNHRKIVIADGRVGFTGGMNIGDEYLGMDPHLGFWRDTHLRLRGPTVLQLQQVFAEDWYYATGQELTQPQLFPEPEDEGQTVAQVLSGGPDQDASVFGAVMFTAINEARDRILLSTCYFVPPPAMLMALETAARRGVRVSLLLARKSAHPWTVSAARSYYETLLQAGVEIHEYTAGMLHAKTLTIDGQWSLVGSPNFDHRSLDLNFEAGVVVYDLRLAEKLEEQFAADFERSEKIELEIWQSRSGWRKLGQNACRLFSPVM